jgi:enterochelin esterase-like enzyme
MSRFMLICAGVVLGAGVAVAQVPPAGRPPTVVSPEVLPDRRVVFRIYAPKAQVVTVNAGDIPAASLAPAPAEPVAAATAGAAPTQTPAGPAGPVFTKRENGVWEATTNPVPPGAFRYVFIVDGVRTTDPVNTRLSESNTATWSLFDVPGLDAAALRDVPHGAVAEVFYQSSVLARTRRMHVYTPPGYESGSRKYAVFYLLHGSGDTDDAWAGVGRAGLILDNLIASGKAAPMIVVMPAGHQPATAAVGAPAASGPVSPGPPSVNPFTQEFVADVMPYVERHYRTIPDRAHRAIAGLSMGGSQTLDIAFRHLADFAYIGVFSSGATLGGGRAAPPPALGVPATATTLPAAAATPRPDWEAVHLADLDNARLKKGTRLVWLATGVDDRLMQNTRTTVELLRKHGFTPEFKESAGGHTWLNWRDYLVEFTPRLFK